MHLMQLGFVSDSDWLVGFSQEKLDLMKTAARLQAPIEVLSVELDHGDTPRQKYYNIRLADGTVCEGISGMHISGIDAWVPAKDPATLTCQYMVEIEVEKHPEGAFLDHDMMVAAIKAQLVKMTEGSGFGGYTTKVGSVTFEGDFYERNL